MGFFDSVLSAAKTALDVAKLPVSASLDTMTAGGELLDEDESYVERNIRQLGEDLDDLYE